MNWQRLARATVVVGAILMLASTPALAGLHPQHRITQESSTIDSSGTDKQTNTYPSIETKTLQVDESGPTQLNGSALQLDGKFGYATGASDSLILDEKSMTIQAWVKHDGNSEDGAVIVQKGNGYGLHFVGSRERARFSSKFPEADLIHSIQIKALSLDSGPT